MSNTILTQTKHMDVMSETSDPVLAFNRWGNNWRSKVRASSMFAKKIDVKVRASSMFAKKIDVKVQTKRNCFVCKRTFLAQPNEWTCSDNCDTIACIQADAAHEAEL